MSERSYIEALSRQVRAPRHAARASHDHALQSPASGTSARLINQRYLLGERIGSGRLGEIYEAIDQVSGDFGVDRRLAIQLIDDPITARPRVVDELMRVYGALRAATHPNIVRIVDFGQDRRTFFVVMDRLEGTSLRSVLDIGAPAPLSFEEAAPLIGAVGNALEYLHAKGIVYGELRPERVFVTSDYRVKLLDVVSATAVPFTPYFTEDATARGVRTAYACDDVYSLACLSYELLAGRHPFNANSPLEARRAKLQPRPLSELTPGSWAAIARGLTFVRAERTPSVAELLRDLGLTGEERLRADDDERPMPYSDAPPPPRIGGASVAAAAPLRRPRPAPWPTERAELPRLRRTEPTEGRSALRAIVALTVIFALAAFWFAYHRELQRAATQLTLEARTLLETALARVAPTKPGVADAMPEPAAAVQDAVPPAQGGRRIDANSASPAAAPAVGGRQSVDTSGSTATETLAPPRAAVPPVKATPRPQTSPPRETASNAAASPAAGAAAPVPPAEFDRPIVTVRESASAATIVIRRPGDVAGPLTVTWWLSEDTAVADQDYVDLGRRTERFAAGESSRTIIIPLVNDNVSERTESFYAYLGLAADSQRHVNVLSSLRVDILDDD